MFPRPPFRVGLNGRGGFEETWLPIERPQGRIMGGPWGSSRFPDPPLSPMPFSVFDDIARNYVNPRPRLSIPESPPTPRFVGQMSMRLPIQEEESRLTQDEQIKALKKLKREVYNPTPKRIAKRVGMYYRGNSKPKNRFDENVGDEDEDGKNCAICLDEFEPKQLVILTPCNHMFHEECIVPWVKSHGQCPVCRFAICERMRQNFVPINNNTAQVPADDLFAGELMSIIRAMDEALEWGRTGR